MAINAGADAVGLVGPMPSGPGIISLDTAKDITSSLPQHIWSFLLTSQIEARAIADEVLAIGTNTVQIVSHVDPTESEKLKCLLPDVRCVQVLHVEDESSIALVDDYAPFVDMFLLDSGRPSAVIPELGGTGRTHDWSLSRKIVERSPVPVFLAGGLTPDNIGEAIKAVRPYGVDICSGVRTNGRLDAEKLERFVVAVKA